MQVVVEKPKLRVKSLKPRVVPLPPSSQPNLQRGASSDFGLDSFRMEGFKRNAKEIQ